MNYALLMSCTKPVTNLAGDVKCFHNREMSGLLQVILEVCASKVFHGNVMKAVHLADIVNPDHVMMSNSARGRDFSLQTFQCIVVVGEQWREDLDRNLLLQLLIICLKNDPHTATTQF